MCTNGPILKWPRVYSFFPAKNTSLVQNTSLSIHIQWNEHRCVRFLCVRWSNGQQTIMLQGLNGIHLFEWWMLIFLIINWCLVLFQWWFIAFFYEVRLQHMDWSASCSWWCAQLALCCCFMSLAMPNPMWSLSHASSRTHIHIQEDIAARQIHHPIICLSFFSFFLEGWVVTSQ